MVHGLFKLITCCIKHPIAKSILLIKDYFCMSLLSDVDHHNRPTMIVHMF